MELLQRQIRTISMVSGSLLTITACSTSSDATKPHQANLTQPANATQTSTNVAIVPPSLANVGEYGENIYDAAKAGNWTTAADKLRGLKDAAHQVRLDVRNANTEDRLDAQVGSVDKAVVGKDRLAAMREANQVTLIAANMSQPFNPKIPVDVVKLDYYGRELEAWTAAKNSGKLQSTVIAVRNTWDGIRRAVESRIGGGTAVRWLND